MSFSWPRIGLLFLSTFMVTIQAFAAEQNSIGSAKIPCEIFLTKPYIIPEDAEIIRNFAIENKMLIGVMGATPEGLPYSKQEGYVAKTGDLKKCKSAKEGDIAGLVQCHPRMFKSHKAWLENRRYLKKLGYTILGEDRNYLVVNAKGEYFYSDYDLLGVYDGSTGRDAYSEEFRAEANRRLGREIIQHGPLEEYRFRKRFGLKFPIMLFSPEGQLIEVREEAELRSVYKRYNIAWRW